MTLLLKVCLLFSCVYTHDIPVTIFDLSFTEEKVELLVKIDIEDLEQLTDNKPDKIHIQNLFDEEMSFTLGTKNLDFEIENIDKDKEFYLIQFEAKSEMYKQAELLIQTSLMVKNDPKHSNIIKVHYNDKTRGFRLHKNRLKTQLRLD